MKRLLTNVVFGAIFGVCAEQSAAQGVSPSAYLTYGSTRFAAIESFEAITGSASQSGIGFGGRLDGLWRGLFADVGFSQQKLDGRRVFLSGDTVFALGIATEITYRPIDLAAGWQFGFNRVRPYVGGGASFLSYKEEADFAQAGDDVDERRIGALLIAGVDVAVVPHLRIGGELRYRAISGVLGVA